MICLCGSSLHRVNIQDGNTAPKPVSVLQHTPSPLTYLVVPAMAGQGGVGQGHSYLPSFCVIRLRTSAGSKGNIRPKTLFLFWVGEANLKTIMARFSVSPQALIMALIGNVEVL